MTPYLAALVLASLCLGGGATSLAQSAVLSTGAPEIFAPGVISGPANDGAPAFTPDGRTLYFTRSGASWGFILESRQAHGRWTTPRIAPFSGQWGDQQPALAPDGSRLIFASFRPPPVDTGAGATAAPGSALWQVVRVGRGWSAPVRLPATVNISPRIFKPSIAADGSLYFMARTDADKTWRLYRAPYRNGTYGNAEPLPFSDGTHTDVDPEIAPDESFLVFSSAGRAADDTHEHLYIVFKTAGAWGSITPVRYAGDRPKGGADDGEAHLGRDNRTLYFTSGRTVPIDRHRTRAQAAQDFARLNAWDNSNNNVWSLSLAPWLDAAKAAGATRTRGAAFASDRDAADVAGSSSGVDGARGR